MIFFSPFMGQTSVTGHPGTHFDDTSLVRDTISGIALGSIALFSAKVVEVGNPRLASILRLAAGGICLMWLWKRLISLAPIHISSSHQPSSSTNYYPYPHTPFSSDSGSPFSATPPRVSRWYPNFAFNSGWVLPFLRQAPPSRRTSISGAAVHPGNHGGGSPAATVRTSRLVDPLPFNPGLPPGVTSRKKKSNENSSALYDFSPNGQWPDISSSNRRGSFPAVAQTNPDASFTSTGVRSFPPVQKQHEERAFHLNAAPSGRHSSSPDNNQTSYLGNNNSSSSATGRSGSGSVRSLSSAPLTRS